MIKKYEFTEELHPKYPNVRRIRALIDIPYHNVKVGDEGGWLEGEHNLSHDGSCWVADEAIVFSHARVVDGAIVCESAVVSCDAVIRCSARIKGRARVRHNAKVGGHAIVSEDAAVQGTAKVFGSAKVEGSSIINDSANVHGRAVVLGITRIYDSASVCDAAQVMGCHIMGNSWVGGDAKVIGPVCLRDEAIVAGNAFLHGRVVVSGHVHIRGDAAIGGRTQIHGTGTDKGSFPLSIGGDVSLPVAGIESIRGCGVELLTNADVIIFDKTYGNSVRTINSVNIKDQDKILSELLLAELSKS